jgi:hypothetical protein
MNYKSITHQVHFALRQKNAVFTFYFLMAIVLLNFTLNVFAFQGRDIIEMYQPLKTLLISFNRVYHNADMTLFLIQLYPVLVVCPAGFILLSEKNRKEDILLLARVGSINYYKCKLIAAFLVTTVVFTVPFFLELILSCASFPIAATGDFSEVSQYDPSYLEMVRRYLFPALYIYNPYLHAIIGIVVFGLFSGILGMFTVALSAVLNIRYKILLFLPVFIILNISLYFSDFIIKLPFSVRWFDYVLLYNDAVKSSYYFVGLILTLIITSISCILFKSKGDQL